MKVEKNEKCCATCKFVKITHGQGMLHLGNGVTICQNGGTNYVCRRPGGVGNITFNLDEDEFSCSAYKKRS